MKKTCWKIKTRYNKFLKKHSISDDDIFWIKLIVWIFLCLGLVFLALWFIPDDAWIGLFGIWLIIFLLYGLYVYRKEIIEFFVDLFWLAKDIVALLIWVLILVAIVAFWVRLFWAVWWWFAWVWAIIILFLILGRH